MRGLCLSCGAFVNSKDYSEKDIRDSGLTECKCCKEKTIICWQWQELESEEVEAGSVSRSHYGIG